jgi:hypothetical protein
MKGTQHDWIASTLGHGETMCSRCFVTNREAAVLGITNTCDVPPPVPKIANDKMIYRYHFNQHVIAWRRWRLHSRLPASFRPLSMWLPEAKLTNN